MKRRSHSCWVLRRSGVFLATQKTHTLLTTDHCTFYCSEQSQKETQSFTDFLATRWKNHSQGHVVSMFFALRTQALAAALRIKVQEFTVGSI